MALMGKIDDFSIVEIFQLISQQQRSGVLTIQSNEKTAEVVFVNGMLSKAYPFYMSPKRNSFGDAAIKARLVNEEGLQRALQKQKENLKSLEESFFDLTLLSQGQIQKINDTLMIETLYDTLQWKSGEYSFTIKEYEHDKRFGTLMSTEHMLLDVLRMIDEEPELLQQISHYGIVFQKILLTEKNIELFDEMGTNEKIIYKFVDGTKTAQDIINQSILGRHNTAKALLSLLGGKYIKKVSEKKISLPKLVVKKNYWEYAAYGLLPIIIVIFLLGLRLIIFSSPVKDTITYKKALAKAHSQVIKNALNVYFLKIGKFPFALSELTEKGLIRKEYLNGPGGIKYDYHIRDDGGYLLGPIG